MVNKDFKTFGEVGSPRVRAEMLDEGLAILDGLLAGKPFQYAGKHYQIKNALFEPTPVQSPRIPVWVAARWPFKRPLRRAARWDGVLPRQGNEGPITPLVIREIADYITRQRTIDTPFDICTYGLTEGKNLARDRALVQEYRLAGATWWIDEIFASRGTPKQIRERITAGPPR
jgi:hypothetical protein